MIANAVTVDDPRIERRPACTLKDDSDLGTIEVTVHVPPLAPDQVERALLTGTERARELCAAGLIEAALLVCQGRSAQVATPHLSPWCAGLKELG